MIQSGKVYRIALPAGKVFPPLPADGVRSDADIRGIRGAVLLASEATDSADDIAFAFGKDPSTFAFMRTTVHRNLYRIPIM